MKKIALIAAVSSALTLFVTNWLGAAEETTRATVLDNARVEVVERIIPAGSVRERHVRPSDQVIVFVSDARYERTDPETGEKTIRERQAGDVIWHYEGETAPHLLNVGDEPLRSMIIGLK